MKMKSLLIKICWMQQKLYLEFHNNKCICQKIRKLLKKTKTLSFHFRKLE